MQLSPARLHRKLALNAYGEYFFLLIQVPDASLA